MYNAFLPRVRKSAYRVLALAARRDSTHSEHRRRGLPSLRSRADKPAAAAVFISESPGSKEGRGGELRVGVLGCVKSQRPCMHNLCQHCPEARRHGSSSADAKKETETFGGHEAEMALFLMPSLWLTAVGGE